MNAENGEVLLRQKQRPLRTGKRGKVEPWCGCCRSRDLGERYKVDANAIYWLGSQEPHTSHSKQGSTSRRNHAHESGKCERGGASCGRGLFFSDGRVEDGGGKRRQEEEGGGQTHRVDPGKEKKNTPSCAPFPCCASFSFRASFCLGIRPPFARVVPLARHSVVRLKRQLGISLGNRAFRAPTP